MSKSSAPAEPKVMPALPAASIDFNKLHDADKAGKTGAELIAAALIEPPAPAVAPAEPDAA